MRIGDLETLTTFHDKLNPDLWENNRLKPQVRLALFKIAKAFVEFINVDDLELTDITISGSNASFNYNNKSDIDLHLIANSNGPCKVNLKDLFQAKKVIFNDQHDITILGHAVEVYVQGSEDAHISNGVYSIYNDNWVAFPKKITAKPDITNIEHKFEHLEEEIKQALESGDPQTIARLKKRIKDMRQSGLEKNGEFGVENLAFKLLRNTGLIQKLYDAETIETDKELSLSQQGVAEGGAETSWSNDTGTITLQDILELTKHIKQINLPINDNLKSKLLHWEGNPEEIERVNQVTVSNQFPILIMVDEQGQIAWILDGNHRLHKAIQSQAKTIPAKLIKPSNLNDKAKKIFNIKEQGVAEGLDQDLPSVLYHATYKPRLKSIKLKGLGAGGKRNWEDSQRGVVYLALYPDVAESYAETSDMVPEEWLDQIVILKISTAGLDSNKFGIDSNVQDNSGDTVEYHGVIPVSNISLYKQGVAEGSLNESAYEEAWELISQPVPEIQQFVKQLGLAQDDTTAKQIAPMIDATPDTQLPAASIPKLKNLANKGNDVQTLKAIQQISGRPDAVQQYAKIMQARDAGEGRQRGYNVSGLINSVKSGNYEAPVLLKLATGTYVIGGRTRLYAALALGIPAKVKIISGSTFAKQGQQGVAEGNAFLGALNTARKNNLEYFIVDGKKYKVKKNKKIVKEEELTEKWSKKYKRSIDCSHPKGFSQKAHCAGRKKK